MRLSQIIIYPIKSARGTSLESTEVLTSGPVHDRRWMVVDQEGRFLSQRRLPRLALVDPHVSDQGLHVTAPGMAPLSIGSWTGEGEWVSVRLWDDELFLPHPSAEASAWFSQFLGHSCRLVHLPDSVVRPVESPFQSPEWRVSLADGYPLLVITEASVTDLNRRLPTPLNGNRFRPNLVIAETEPHAEDGWREISVGVVRLALVKPCARCSTVLVDQESAAVGLEPLRTLASYRRQPRSVMFGQNALVLEAGRLRVGDPVKVTR